MALGSQDQEFLKRFNDILTSFVGQLNTSLTDIRTGDIESEQDKEILRQARTLARDISRNAGS